MIIELKFLNRLDILTLLWRHQGTYPTSQLEIVQKEQKLHFHLEKMNQFCQCVAENVHGYLLICVGNISQLYRLFYIIKPKCIGKVTNWYYPLFYLKCMCAPLSLPKETKPDEPNLAFICIWNFLEHVAIPGLVIYHCLGSG